MRTVLFLLVSLGFCDVLYAAENPPVNYPLFQGVIEGGALRIPSFKETHANPPEKLFAYGDKEYVATLRKKNPFVPREQGWRGSCDDEHTGSYFYDIQPATKKEIPVIIYDQKKKLKFYFRNKNIDFKELDTGYEWLSGSFTGGEGLHSIWRAKKAGKCIGHIDYYTHCDYDTEPDGDEHFVKQMMCGEWIDGSGF